MHTLTTILDRLREPRLQLTIIALLISYMGMFIYYLHTETHYVDKVQSVLEIPSATKSISSRVSVGVHVNNFPEFSFHKNKFVLDMVVWFKFPIGSESMQTVENFSFQNGKILKKSPPLIQVSGDSVIITYQTLAEIKTHLDYSQFPVSDHRLNVVLENRRVTPNELYFESHAHNFALSDEIMVSTWSPKKKIVKPGYIKSILTEAKEGNIEVNYPCVVFSLEFMNNSIRNLASLYLPLFMLFFIAFFSMLIDIAESSLRITLIAGALPTLVLFRLVIDTLTPEGSNITKVDYLYYILVFLSLVLLLFQVYVLLVHRRIKKMGPRVQEARLRDLENANSLIFASIILVLIASVTYTHVFM